MAEVRVVTYNVHEGRGRGGRPSASLVLDILEELDADLVSLQEVLDEESGDPRLLDGLDRLGYRRVIHGPTMRKERGDFGNVLLTRMPLIRRELIDLSVPGREPRGAIRAWLETEGGPVEVVGTHLGLRSRERRWQARRLARILGSAEGERDAALRLGLGDFNEWFPWARSLRVLSRALGPSRGARTFPAAFPVAAIDRIFVHPPGALRSLESARNAKTRVASDHLPLVGIVEL